MKQVDEETLTAYALGELDESERAAVEALLAESSEARNTVAEIRDAAGLIEQELRREACPTLTARQEQTISDEAASPSRRRIVPWRRAIGLAIAASLVLIVGATLLSQTRSTLSSNEAMKVAAVPDASQPDLMPADESELKTKEQLRGIGYLGGEATGADTRGYRPKGIWFRTTPPQTSASGEVPFDDFDYSTGGSASGASGGYGGGGFGGAGGYGGGLAGPPQEEPPPIRQDEARLMALQQVHGNLQNVQVGGSIRIRGNYFAEKLAEEPTQANVQLLAAASEQPPQSSTGERLNAESYAPLGENVFLMAAQQPLSTFSIDVDTASYSNVRRFITQGQRPPKDAVRIEEMVNYFSYDYAPPADARPFAVHAEVTGCPWTPEHRLVRIGLKGKEIAPGSRKPCNFAFLLDVSGSMEDANKLPLLKKAMKLLVEGLSKDDTVSLVTFSDASRMHLTPTTCDQKQVIEAAIDELRAGGSTNGGAGLELAYDLVKEHAVKDGNNRVILGTDGDFNVGVTQRPDLVNLVQDCAKSGIFLTVMGFGQGNLQDSNLESLADKGNGNYAYIDTFNEARRVLCEQMAGTLITIAKDVKVQVEFNPGKVSAYRLIGYENRVLAARDFNDDRKDAGDIGSGHTVTTLYEVAPVGVAGPMPGVDNLKFQKPPEAPANLTGSDALLDVKLRYKLPDADTSELIEFPVTDTGAAFDAASADAKFAAAVAEFGMVLRDSDAKGNATYDSVLELAQQAKGPDPNGYRAEFVNLVNTAKSLGNR